MAWGMTFGDVFVDNKMPVCHLGEAGHLMAHQYYSSVRRHSSNDIVHPVLKIPVDIAQRFVKNKHIVGGD